MLVYTIALIWLLGSSWARIGGGAADSARLSLPAFCREAPAAPVHPVKFAEAHIPWVWEATHDPVTKNVDVVIMMPNSCYFNHTKWMEVSKQFPQYGKHLGHGDRSKILVHAEEDAEDKFVDSLIGQTAVCHYYLKGKLARSDKSVPINAMRPYMGPMLIRCPLPDENRLVVFDSLQLEVKIPEFAAKRGATTNRTALFPVCTLPSYQPQHRQYNLSVITATGRDNAEQLVEWIEYHLLVGVEHFFVYNTANSVAVRQKLSGALSYYLRRGIVTEVVWPYANCLAGEGMAKGRNLQYISAAHGGADQFKPPCPIAAYGAHASAYTRFRHTSKYLMYVDDDEFLSLTNQLAPHEHSIVYVAESIFAKHPKAPSVAFLPIGMSDCPVRDKEAGIVRPQQPSLPRLVTRHYGRIGRHFEYKQLLRTDLVALFSVHYLSLLEAAMNPTVVSMDEPFFIRIQHGALLHYKTPPWVSQDPFSSTEMAPIETLPQVNECHDSVDMNVTLSYPLNIGASSGNSSATGFFQQKVLHHVLPPRVLEQLKYNYAYAKKQMKP